MGFLIELQMQVPLLTAAILHDTLFANIGLRSQHLKSSPEAHETLSTTKCDTYFRNTIFYCQSMTHFFQSSIRNAIRHFFHLQNKLPQYEHVCNSISIVIYSFALLLIGRNVLATPPPGSAGSTP